MEGPMSGFLTAFWIAMTACIFGPPPSDPSETAPQVQLDTDKPIACAVKSEGKKIVAMVRANEAQSGSFSLEINKKGANTARTRQRGEFMLAAGETKPIAVVMMSAASNEKIAGHLLVEWNGGQTKCDLK